MLEMALRAKLPIISVSTTDTVNVVEVLSHLAGGETFIELEASHIPKLNQTKLKPEYDYLYLVEPIDYKKWDLVHEAMITQDRCLVLVNPSDKASAMFDAGEVPTPEELVFELIARWIPEEDVPPVSRVLSGLTLKEVTEICCMAMTAVGELTPASAMSVRRQVMTTVKGMYQVDTSYPFYKPDAELEKWVSVDGKCFKADLPQELVPRGLLFGGPPGVGKTMGAKYIANRLGVPLFRLDIGSMMGKWVGDSEAALRNALRVADNAAPCVVLIDEAEKPFKGGDDAGVTSRMLSGLLWWLQEHTTRVLTILTTNNWDILPKELYRPGRIDETLKFMPIEDPDEAYDFMKSVLSSLQSKVNLSSHHSNKLSIAVAKMATGMKPGDKTHANLTQVVYSLVKRVLAKSI